MGLFVNLAAAGGFTLQSGAPDWLYNMPGWVFSSFRGCVILIRPSSCPLTA